MLGGRGGVVWGVFSFAAPAAATTWVAQSPPLTGLNPAAGSKPSALLEKDSCAAVGWCVAVGTYTDGGGSHQGLIETLSDGRFTATTAPLAGLSPAAGANPQVFMFDVSCPVTGWCVADGQYADSSDQMHLFAEMLSNGSWHATTLPLTGLNPAADASALPGVSSMSCPAEGACVIVGAYTAKSLNQPLTERLAGGAWQAQTAPVDTLSPAGSMGQLFDVSCSSSGACTAVGRHRRWPGRSRREVVGWLVGGLESVALWTDAKTRGRGIPEQRLLLEFRCLHRSR